MTPPMPLEMKRLERWVKASHAAGRYEPFMVQPIQGLGKLDVSLIETDRKIVDSISSNPESIESSLELTEQLTQSWLWVLGGYEIVRTISEFTSKSEDLQVDVRNKIAGTKKSFARIRMPLAKFQAATKHKTDSHTAYPALNTTKGVAWQIATDCTITRRELSDDLLDMLESIKESPR